MSIPATTARLDCIIIGHHELDVSLLAQEAQVTQWLSGAYLSLASLTLVDHGQRLSYQTFLKQYITATTGQAPQLPTLYHTPNLTVCYLAHYLRRRQFSVASINFFTDQQDQLAALLTHQPRAVAITTTLYTRDLPIVEIVDFVRRRSPQTTIIVGGPHVFKACLHGRERMMAHGIGADLYVQEAQGEATLARILQALQTTATPDWATIPNLLFPTGDTLTPTPREPETQSLNDTAMDWRQMDPTWLQSVTTLRTARSCAYKCAFCDFPAMAGELTLMDLSVLDQELAALAEMGVTRLYFVDDTFNVPLPRFKALCRMMIDRRYGFEWYSFFRCGNANPETFDLMARSGCGGVFLGIESGSQPILNNMNKKVTVARYEEGIRQLNAHGIVNIASFIIGFPGETRDTAMETLEFINRTQPTLYTLNLYHHDRHAPIHRQADAYGLTGHGFSWKHRTMTWQEAGALMVEMHQTLTDPPCAPWGISMIPYMKSQGLTLPEIMTFYREAKVRMLQGLPPVPQPVG